MRPALSPPRRTAALLAGLALAPAAAGAQQVPAATGAGVGYEVYRFSDPDAAQVESLSLLTVPLAARFTVADRLRVDVSGAFARGVLERPDGSQASFAGPTDTQLRLTVPAGALSFTGMIALPTGSTTPDQEEVAVVGAIASDLLPFRISHWGAGGGGGVGVTLAHSFGGVGVGVGGSYLVRREFEPVADAGLAAYRPGNQLSLEAVLNATVGRTGKAALQATYQRQDDDELEGANLYRSGDRLQAVASYAFRVARRSSGLLYAGAQHRERGTALLEVTRDSPSQDLFMAGAGLRLPTRAGVLLPGAELRVLRSADGVGQGWLGGVGASMEWPVGPLEAGPRVRARWGNVLVREGVDSDFVGVDVGLALHF